MKYAVILVFFFVLPFAVADSQDQVVFKGTKQNTSTTEASAALNSTAPLFYEISAQESKQIVQSILFEEKESTPHIPAK